MLTTPVIRALKEKYPESEIDFLVKPQFISAVNTNIFIDHVYEFDKNKNYEVVINTLMKNKYDLVIDLQNNFRSRRISSKLSVKTYRFRKPTIKKFFLVNFKWNLFKQIKTIPEMYFETLPGLEFNGYSPELFIPENIPASIKPNKYIGFAPGAKHFTKMWPIEYYIELGKMLTERGYTILLFGGRDDNELCTSIHQAIPESINLSTKDNLLQIARDMKECELVVCNDSGLMHTAVSVGVPVAAIFGSTVKEFGFFPYADNSLVLENIGLSCRPCSHIGRDKCPKGHLKCMLEQTPENVFESINNLTR